MGLPAVITRVSQQVLLPPERIGRYAAVQPVNHSLDELTQPLDISPTGRRIRSGNLSEATFKAVRSVATQYFEPNYITHGVGFGQIPSGTGLPAHPAIEVTRVGVSGYLDGRTHGYIMLRQFELLQEFGERDHSKMQERYAQAGLPPLPFQALEAGVVMQVNRFFGKHKQIVVAGKFVSAAAINFYKALFHEQPDTEFASRYAEGTLRAFSAPNLLKASAFWY
jgi:hypothetical protein